MQLTEENQIEAGEAAVVGDMLDQVGARLAVLRKLCNPAIANAALGEDQTQATTSTGPYSLPAASPAVAAAAAAAEAEAPSYSQADVKAALQQIVALREQDIAAHQADEGSREHKLCKVVVEYERTVQYMIKIVESGARWYFTSRNNNFTILYCL